MSLQLLRLAGTGLAGNEAGSDDHREKSDTDENVMHLEFSLWRAFAAAFLTLLESRHSGILTIPLPLCEREQGWYRRLTRTGYMVLTCEDRAGRERSGCVLNVCA